MFSISAMTAVIGTGWDVRAAIGIVGHRPAWMLVGRCQHEKTAAWLQKQTQRLLPVHYFLVTFTVPEALRLYMGVRERLASD